MASAMTQKTSGSIKTEAINLSHAEGCRSSLSFQPQCFFFPSRKSQRGTSLFESSQHRQIASRKEVNKLIRKPEVSKPSRVSSFKVSAQVAASDSEVAAGSDFSSLKEFLEDAKAVGSVRIIVNTGMGVLESVTTLEKLFYHAMPGKGMYANLMNNEDNVDFHLLLDKVARVNLVTAKSKRGDFMTYTIRFYDKEAFNGASIFVMWKSGTMGEYAEGQVEAFKRLLDKYGEEVSFD